MREYRLDSLKVVAAADRRKVQVFALESRVSRARKLSLGGAAGDCLELQALLGVAVAEAVREEARSLDMARFCRLIACLVALFFSLPALAEKRVALVIGNSAYKHAPELANPRNDAEGVAASLKRLNFDVLLGTDLAKQPMELLLKSFSDKLDGAEVALVFYAGHGLQVNGSNYLVPIDAKLDKEADLVFEAISLDLVQRLMEQSQRVSIMVLDACRDNPLARNLARTMGTRSAGIGRGLGQSQAGIGTLIVYATQPGNVALDGEGRNSPFTAALLANLEAPGLEIRQVFTRVRQAVIQTTKGKQVPWDSSSLTGDFFFAAAPATGVTPPSSPSTPAPDQEAIFWQTIRDGKSIADFREYLKRWPEGVFAGLAKRRISELEKGATTVLDCALLKQAEASTGENAIGAYREAGERCTTARERIAAYHGLARLQFLVANNVVAAEAAIEAARALIVENFGANDLAMAGNRQLYAMTRARLNDSKGALEANAVAARIRNATVDAWDESEGPVGAVGHKGSGLKLPFRAGSLVQFRRDIYNDDGTDVSLGYRTTGASVISVTVFVSKRAGDFASQFAAARSAIRAQIPNAVLKGEESKVLRTNAGRIEGRLARFEYTAQGVVGTRLYLFPSQNDLVKLRVTYPRADEASVEAQVAALLAAIVWPTR